eukprot:TRINITY_DN14111_c0_g1_i1.p1 TRINITY_DN14111_c0_g1~~TRINITY_DN14111_c0_g1_i1.p1  ORF type:complete len:321 (+),score=33.97 TRINITY_DN14111_c0_g1_i1:73-1035(+)
MYSSMAMAPPQLLGVAGIIREALRIPCRNAKLMLSITLFMILSYCLLLLGNQFSINPLIFDLITKYFSLPTKDPRSPEYAEMLNSIQKDIKILVGIEVIFFAAICVVSVLKTMAIIYVSTMAYSGKQLSFKELFLTIRRTWKRPVITWLYVTLLCVGYVTLLVVVVGVFFVLAKGSLVLVALVVLLSILALLFYAYLAVVWILGLVVSVVEEGFCGVKALGKAEELIKGRRLQGYFLALLISLVSIPISTTLGHMMGDVHKTAAARLAIGLVGITLACILDIISIALYVVFYCECKKSHGEEVELQGDMGYSRVPTGSPC